MGDNLEAAGAGAAPLALALASIVTLVLGWLLAVLGERPPDFHDLIEVITFDGSAGFGAVVSCRSLSV
jgi:hypothetical protein